MTQVLLLPWEALHIIPSAGDSSLSHSLIRSCLSVVGSSPFGNPMRDGQRLIPKYSRAHVLFIILSGSDLRPRQFITVRALSIGGKLASRNDTSLEQFSNFNFVRNVRLPNAFGSFFKLEHHSTFKYRRLQGSLCPSKNSTPSQLLIFKFQRLPRLSTPKHVSSSLINFQSFKSYQGLIKPFPRTN